MKKIYKSRKGFTLIELLATVVIIGILLGASIVTVLHFIDKAREEQVASQEKTLTIAARSYLQEYRSLLPKSIGEVTRVTAKVLKDNNYLTEDIKNAKKESCMNNSYVDVKKESQSKYSYKVVYCGNEEIDDSSNHAQNVSIKIDFVNADGVSFTEDADILKNVAEARYKIVFNGGTKPDGTEVGIDGYSYSILTKLEGEENYREQYSSGTLNANHAHSIDVEGDRRLIDYIDVTGKTNVLIRATLRNLTGDVVTETKLLGDENSDNPEVTFYDDKAPKCVGTPRGEAVDDDDWINIYSAVGERRITVACSDGSGSGCVRSSYTKTWNGNEPVEYGVMEIKDNAGNLGDKVTCKVRVNIDKEYPVISIDAYPKSRGTDDKDDVRLDGSSSVLTGTKSTIDSSTASVTINPDEYTDLRIGYMNSSKYPGGVIYEVNVSDGLKVADWKWEVNESNIFTRDGSYEDVSLNPDLNEDDIIEAKTGTCGKKSCSFKIKLYNNGYRKGVLTVKDIAGNIAKYTIYADINRIGPSSPKIINSSSVNNNEVGEWTKDDVRLNITTDTSKLDIGDYYYSYKLNSNGFSLNEEDADSKWVKLSGGTGKFSFDTEYWTKEINKEIYVMVCDIAENCSEIKSTNRTEIKIDRTAPTGLELVGYKKKDAQNITNVDIIPSLNLTRINSGEWTKGWAIIVPTGATDEGSGIANYKVTVTGESAAANDVVQGYRNVNADGVSTVTFKACDKVGNCSVPSEPFVVKLDNTGPFTPRISPALGGQTWSTEAITMTIESDDLLNDMGKYYYSYVSSATETGNNPATQWVELTNGRGQKSFEKKWEDDINKIVYIKACDVLGNCSELANAILKIDHTNPTAPIISNPNNNKWSKTDYSLTLESSDGTGSGLASYQYTYNANATEIGDDASTQWKLDGRLAKETYETSDEFIIEGDNIIYWRACDGLGNCSEKSSTRIKVDKKRPVCGDLNLTVNNDEDGVSGSIACTDTLSGCKKNSESFTSLKETTAIEIEDNAGNTNSCTVPVSGVDCSATASWLFVGTYSPYSNGCPDDDVGWNYSFYTCSNSNKPDVCDAPCASECSNILTCRRVCCTRQRKTEKTCYSVIQN